MALKYGDNIEINKLPTRIESALKTEVANDIYKILTGRENDTLELFIQRIKENKWSPNDNKILFSLLNWDYSDNINDQLDRLNLDIDWWAMLITEFKRDKLCYSDILEQFIEIDWIDVIYELDDLEVDDDWRIIYWKYLCHESNSFEYFVLDWKKYVTIESKIKKDLGLEGYDVYEISWILFLELIKVHDDKEVTIKAKLLDGKFIIID